MVCPYYSVLMNTLSHSLSEAVIGIKFSDVLALYPQMPLSELPLLMSETNRKKMRALMPFLDAHPSVEGLVTSSKGSSKGNGMDEPVLNRPWEWTEYLGDGATPEADDESVRKLVKNTAALSLDLFDAHGTGEVLPGVVREGDSAALTTFYDSLTTESVYARSWRDARSATADSSVPPPRSAVDVEGHEPPAWLASQYPGRTPYTSQPLVGGSRPGSRGTSPASSTYSRTPFLPSGSGPVRVSPVHGNFAGTPQGAITPGGSRRPNKRKAPQAVDLDDDDDDDIIILDAPPVPSTSHNTRPQPRPVGKRR
jgi:mediator of RNA polymerase II transcription subunit 12